MISSPLVSQSKKQYEKSVKETVNSNKKYNTEKYKNTENDNFRHENTLEIKIKKSILGLICDLCVITGEYGGYLDGCVGLCVWHITPLLSQHEVPSMKFFMPFHSFLSFILFVIFYMIHIVMICIELKFVLT